MFSSMEMCDAGDSHSERGRAAEALPSGDNNWSWGGRKNRPLDHDRDIIQTVMRFLGGGNFLPVAGVSVHWRDAWGDRPPLTSRRWAVQSVSCFAWARACGLDIRDNPCLHAAAEGRLEVLQYAVALGYSREGMPICEHAAGGGHLKVVKWCRAFGYPWGRSCIRAAERGRSEVLQWWVANGYPMSVEILKASVANANAEDSASAWKTQGRVRKRLCGVSNVDKTWKLETVRWCFEQHYPWPQETCYAAARGGHFGLLRWLRAISCPWSPNTMQGAIEAKHMEILEWCKAAGCPWIENAWDVAVRGGNLEIVRWCVDNDPGDPLSIMTCLPAIQHGHLEVLQWLRARGCPWGHGACYAAASGGHFRLLRWCVENGCPWGKPFASKHGFTGSLSMMEWADANGCPWARMRPDVEKIRRHAASQGNLEIVQWCEKCHPSHNPGASLGAASNGHVHVLRWLRANGTLSDGSTSTWLRATGSPSDTSVYSSLCEVAATSGSLEAVQWCRSNGYPWNESTCAAAAGSGNLELLRWCRENGCPWDEGTCDRAAGSGNLELLQWCWANGCPWGEETCSRAAERGDLEMLAWCRTRGCPWNMSTLLSAARRRRLEVVEWCVVHEGPMTTRRVRILESKLILQRVSGSTDERLDSWRSLAFS